MWAGAFKYKEEKLEGRKALPKFDKLFYIVRPGEGDLPRFTTCPGLPLQAAALQHLHQSSYGTLQKYF